MCHVSQSYTAVACCCQQANPLYNSPPFPPSLPAACLLTSGMTRTLQLVCGSDMHSSAYPLSCTSSSSMPDCWSTSPSSCSNARHTEALGWAVLGWVGWSQVGVGCTPTGPPCRKGRSKRGQRGAAHQPAPGLPLLMLIGLQRSPIASCSPASRTHQLGRTPQAHPHVAVCAHSNNRAGLRKQSRHTKLTQQLAVPC